MRAFLLTLILAMPPALPGNPLEALPSPPFDAKAGQSLHGVEIGLWSQKKQYKDNEIRNIWIFARKKDHSGVTIGVGGDLFRRSIVYVTRVNGDTKKIPIDGGIDGMKNPSEYYGCIANSLKALPRGTYSLVWKTDQFESNRLNISIQ